MIEKVTVRMTDQSGFHLTSYTTCDDLNPKALLLYAAARCAGYTLSEILGKQHITPRECEITVSGELSTPTLEAGSVFRSFNVHYNVACSSLDDQEKIGRAVTLTHEKYCGMIRMLTAIAPVAHEVAIVSTEPAGQNRR